MNSLFTKSVFKYFKEISCIPRNSGNEAGIRDYLIKFAVDRNLKYYADSFNNVIIYKKTANIDPIMLQAHTDMVCVKTQVSNFDFDEDPIEVFQKGNFLAAKNTSLGADDGIGVALILDILDSKIPCNIEAVFTSNEETTMLGALNLNVKKVKAKRLITLDGFEANTIMTSSASFIDYYVITNVQKFFIDNTEKLKTFKLTLAGLDGGHSGYDIDKNRGSSHKLLAKLLLQIPDIQLNNFWGGHNYNVIPSRSEAIFSTEMDEKDLKLLVKKFYIENQKIFRNLKIKCERQLNQTLVLKNGREFLKFIDEFKHGVLLKDQQNNVVASQNLSEIDGEKGYFKIGIRCNDIKQEKTILTNLKKMCEKYSYLGKALDRQPAFNTLEKSNLLNDLKKANPSAKEIKMHICVESGILQDRMKNLDVVIISPTIIDAHSTKERVNIKTVIDTSNWLKTYLKMMVKG